MIEVVTLYLLGTIHKGRRQVFRIFDTPLSQSHFDSFFSTVLWQFLPSFFSSPPSQLPTSFIDGPLGN